MVATTQGAELAPHAALVELADLLEDRELAVASLQPVQAPVQRKRRPRTSGSSGSLWKLNPTGTSRSICARSLPRLSGRSFAMRLVFAATIPQPMSTPTAAGMIAARVAITVPTVAPLPRCTSGITATWPARIGSRVTLRICSSAPCSTSMFPVQRRAPGRTFS
jgi:hypothetical protein